MNFLRGGTRWCLPVLLLCALPDATGGEDYRQRVAQILQQTPLIDGHNDLPFTITRQAAGRLDEMPLHKDLSRVENPTHTDLPRLRRGMVGGQFWSVYIPIDEYPGAAGDASRVLAQMDLVYRMLRRYPGELELALTSADIPAIHQRGRIASLMGIEGGHAIENSLATLRMLYLAGARYMTLTHSKGLCWADSATDDARVGGLSGFGREVVREMNRLGMLVDLSHVSFDTMHDALDVSTAPVLFSHSNAYALTAHNRNVPDEILLRLKKNGGIVMVTFFPAYVSEATRLAWQALQEAIEEETADPKERRRRFAERRGDLPRPTLAQVADHIDHIRRLIGVEHIGLGGDYDGMPTPPAGLEDVSTYPALFIELMRRGYTDKDIAAIAGSNLLRVMAAAEAVADKAAGRPPSDLLIQENAANGAQAASSCSGGT